MVFWGHPVIDLGSFTTPEEAAAAYQAAKNAGRTARPSPKHNRIQRGTGTNASPAPNNSFCLHLSCNDPRGVTGEKALKAQRSKVLPPQQIQSSYLQSLIDSPFGQPLHERSAPAMNLPFGVAMAMPLLAQPQSTAQRSTVVPFRPPSVPMPQAPVLAHTIVPTRAQ